MPVLLRKKPVEVQAVQWKGDNKDELKAFCGESIDFTQCRCKAPEGAPVWNDHTPKPEVVTWEGKMKVVPNAWVVKGVKGEFYPVDPSVFDETFEFADASGEAPANKADASDDAAMEALFLAVEALSAADRKDLPSSDFALPKERRYPIHNAKHVKLAWRMLNAGNLDAKEKAEAKRRILERAKKLDVDVSGWDTANESIDGDTPMDVVPYLWNQASEEASETGQAAAKCLRFGYTSIDPRNDKVAVDRYREELADQLGVIVLINDVLAERGQPVIEPVTDDMIAASVEKRKENLRAEYEQGRFTFKS